MLKRFFFILCFLAVTAHSVSADHEDIVFEHTMETADKKYLFVMLKGGTVSNPFVPTQADKYPQNGLYLNDGSNTPLWTVDWCANVLLPADGIHIVRKGRHTLPIEFNEEVITFLANGEELKSYRVNDLVQFPRLLPASSNYYEWQKVIPVDAGATPFTINIIGESKNFSYPAGVIFDEAAHTMHLETNQGDSYVFDLKTGEIISSHRPVRFIFLTLVISGMLLYLFYLFGATGKAQKRFTRALLITGFSAFMIGFLIAATEFVFGDTFAAWASNYETSGFVSNFFYTLFFYFPYKTMDDFGREILPFFGYPETDYAAKIFCFWFSVSFITGLLNYGLVSFVRLLRKKLFKNMKLAVAALLLMTILFTSSAHCMFEQMS